MTEVTHRVLCYRGANRGLYFGKCPCGATTEPVECQDDLQGAIRQHHPLAQ